MSEPRPMPTPPLLNLAALEIDDLVTMSLFMRSANSGGLAILNEPRCAGAGDRLVDMFLEYLHGIQDVLVDELLGRVPASRWEAEQRADALMPHLLLAYDYAGAAALVETLAEEKQQA